MGLLLVLSLSFIIFPFSIKACIVFIISSIVFLLTFSYGNSTDFFTYLYLFDLFENIDPNYIGIFVQGVEFSFFSLSYIFHSFSLNGHALLSLYSVTSFLLIVFAFKKFRQSYICWVFFLLLYINVFFFVSITLYRQALAAAIVFYAVCNLLNNNNKKEFITLIMLAGLFHTSAILFIFIPILLKVRLNLTKSVMIFLICAFLGFFNPFQYLIGFLPSAVAKFGKYLLSNPLPINQKIYSLVITLVLFLIYFSILFMREKLINRPLSGIENSIALLFFLVIIIRLFAISIGSFGRLSIYVILFMPIFFNVFFVKYNSYNSKLILIVLLYLVSLIKLASLVNIGSGLNNYDSLVLNFCFIDDECPIELYGETSFNKFLTFFNR